MVLVVWYGLGDGVVWCWWCGMVLVMVWYGVV